MRFKTSNIKEAKHTELVSCVGWASPDDVISIGDDHQILRWNLVSAETVKVIPIFQCFLAPSRRSRSGYLYLYVRQGHNFSRALNLCLSGLNIQMFS